MKILIVGDWHSDLHEQELFNSFLRLNHEVSGFRWCDYFKTSQNILIFKLIEALIKKISNRFIIGPIISRINKDFLNFAVKYNPDLVFIYRGTHIKYSTLLNLKKILPRSILISYNNDDPFSELHPKYLWRFFLKNLPLFDINFVYRQSNIKQFIDAGARNVNLLRSWYVKNRHYPVTLNYIESSFYATDVVFIGHYEPDGRLELLEEVVRNQIKLKIFGPAETWKKPLLNSMELRHLWPVKSVWGDDYNKALCGARIALCFFSKLNNDTYTRRCFEIPATKTFLLCEYSSDLASIYKEGIEVEFFRDKSELIRKIKFYLNNLNLNKIIALNGFEKVINSGHDSDSRAVQIFSTIHELKKVLDD